jgi:CheY-like chemotaxis protein
MERVVVNVVQNAIKYTPAGGRVSVGVRACEETPSQLVLDVRDNGIGIPRKYLNRVTDRYFRVGEQVTGSGLGLAIAKELAELHGGSIRLNSPVPGQEGGTQVLLALPRVDPPSVLVAISNREYCSDVATQLREEGYLVHACSDGADAMNILRSSAVDVALLDFAAEGLDGIELLAKLKSNLEWGRISVIASVDGELDRMKSELIQGFQIQTVTYPVARDNLFRVMDKALTDGPAATVQTVGANAVAATPPSGDA